MSEKLLGNALLGQGQGGSVAGGDGFGSPPYYLINDIFTTNRAAGAVNNTDAEPGPGRRVVVDSNSKLSLSGGAVSLATGGVGGGDPGLWYGALERVVGRLIVVEVSWSVGGIEIGFDAGQSGGVSDSVRSTTTTLTCRANGTLVTVGTVATSTTYQFAVVERATGSFHFIKGGIYTNWTLIWISTASAGLYPAAIAIGATTVGTLGFVRVPATPWLPAPLLSHGFAALTPSDGAGHAEGVTGGLGSGGGAMTVTSFYGTWGVAGGVAQCSALNSGIGLLGGDVGKADLIVTAKVTVAGGVAGLFVREDADDRVIAVHNGTNAQLIKRVSGVDTTLVNAAATYVAGAEIRLVCEGQKFRLFYNNVAVGTEQTIADGSLQSETLAGVYTTNAGNTFDDLVVRARGSGGEYAALDAF